MRIIAPEPRRAIPARHPAAPSRPPLEPLADLKRRLDIADVVGRHVALKRRGLYQRWGCCPFHRERTPSFKVDVRTGRYHCFGCGADGDAIDFLAALEGLDTVAAIKRGRELAGGGEVRVARPGPALAMVDREAEKRRELAQEVWRETVSLCACAGDALPWRYLTETRGIGRWDPDRLRFHPACPWGASKVPCIVAPVNDHRTGNVVGIWRVRFTLAGKVERWGLGPMKGNAARLYHAPGPRLVIAEGVEDALAAHELTGWPAWAALNAGNMAALVLPERFRAVLILGDRDENGTGQDAAVALARRLRTEGREAVARAPEALKDPNDVLRSGRSAG